MTWLCPKRWNQNGQSFTTDCVQRYENMRILGISWSLVRHWVLSALELEDDPTWRDCMMGYRYALCFGSYSYAHYWYQTNISYLHSSASPYEPTPRSYPLTHPLPGTTCTSPTLPGLGSYVFPPLLSASLLALSSTGFHLGFLPLFVHRASSTSFPIDSTTPV